MGDPMVWVVILFTTATSCYCIVCLIHRVERLEDGVEELRRELEILRGGTTGR